MNFTEKHTDYLHKLNESLAHFKDLSLAKKRLSFWRWKASENLDKLLFEFDTNVKKNGWKNNMVSRQCKYH
jgi:L-lactate utilization protein LutB